MKTRHQVTKEEINNVKTLLPMVRVKWQGSYYWARVTGRLNRFATVSPFQKIETRRRVQTILGPCYEVAWETVTRCANDEKPIIL